ncbi:MAG: ethanolamine ammonia-lyase subunit EutC [Deltaproteobacteria bacterium]|nr:MAG: ethanolamine ammonia-lyase subunit EutC [Deltaproteobacteria bacterium]
MSALSRTRELVAALRHELGAQDPLPPAPPLPKVEPPPVRVFPTRRTESRYAQAASAHTTALLGIGHVGTRYATDVVLQFQAELAVAHEAVGTELPDDWAARNGLLPLRTRVADHREFLLRPDLGRRLDDASLARLRSDARRGVDVQPILADGLSAVACMGSGLALLEAYTRELEARGLTVGTPMCAKFARVWLEDEIGEAVGAKVAAILLGERPGLGTGDGLSAYLVFGPRVGKTDGDRNMMSNIHARGTPPEQAGRRLAVLTRAMLDQGTSGVALDLANLAAELGEAAGTAYRAPQKRVRLVEVER